LIDYWPGIFKEGSEASRRARATVQRATAVPIAEEIYVPKMYQGDLWSNMLSPEVRDHFKSMIPFEMVQKVMDRAGDVELNDGGLELAQPLPEMHTTARWNFEMHGDVKGPPGDSNDLSSAIPALTQEEQLVNILLIISDDVGTVYRSRSFRWFIPGSERSCPGIGASYITFSIDEHDGS